jgi:hypothetical protein
MCFPEGKKHVSNIIYTSFILQLKKALDVLCGDNF